MLRPEAGVLLVAAGGLARETAVAARAAGQQVLGCLDDDASLWGSEVAPGLPVHGPVESVVDHPDAALVLCAGIGVVRERLARRLAAQGAGEDRYVSVVHPTVVMPPDDRETVVSEGCILLAGVVLTAAVRLGRHVVCMPNAVVTHDCLLEEFATVCAGVVLGGRVSVGRAAYLGMASSVRQAITVGEGATLGMGAAAVCDIPPGETWVGVPARPLSERPPATTPSR